MKPRFRPPPFCCVLEMCLHCTAKLCGASAPPSSHLLCPLTTLHCTVTHKKFKIEEIRLSMFFFFVICRLFGIRSWPGTLRVSVPFPLNESSPLFQKYSQHYACHSFPRGIKFPLVDYFLVLGNNISHGEQSPRPRDIARFARAQLIVAAVPPAYFSNTTTSRLP